MAVGGKKYIIRFETIKTEDTTDESCVNECEFDRKTWNEWSIWQQNVAALQRRGDSIIRSDSRRRGIHFITLVLFPIVSAECYFIWDRDLIRSVYKLKPRKKNLKWIFYCSDNPKVYFYYQHKGLLKCLSYLIPGLVSKPSSQMAEEWEDRTSWSPVQSVFIERHANSFSFGFARTSVHAFGIQLEETIRCCKLGGLPLPPTDRQSDDPFGLLQPVLSRPTTAYPSPRKLLFTNS